MLGSQTREQRERLLFESRELTADASLLSGTYLKERMIVAAAKGTFIQNAALKKSIWSIIRLPSVVPSVVVIAEALAQ